MLSERNEMTVDMVIPKDRWSDYKAISEEEILSKGLENHHEVVSEVSDTRWHIYRVDGEILIEKRLVSSSYMDTEFDTLMQTWSVSQKWRVPYDNVELLAIMLSKAPMERWKLAWYTRG